MDKKTTAFLLAIVALSVVGSIMILIKSGNPASTANTSKNQLASSTEDQKLGDIVDMTSQSAVTMDIKDFKYEKPNIKIKKGTKVTWTNQDTMKHNVMEEHEGSDKAHNPPEASEIDPNELAGPLLATDESYSFTFNEVSVAPYHCSPHPYMKGSVTVVE